ncbi:MAG: phage holin family protein [Oscillospiraceae bacterium]|nr:phage holin family protein [Oscillospiraceae bacterium]
MEQQDIFIAVGLALFAMFGSCVKWLNTKTGESLNLSALVIEAVSAAFSGALIFCIYEWQGLNAYVAFCFAGIAGNFGAKGIDIISRIFVKMTGLKNDINEIDKNGGNNQNGADNTDKRD